LVTVPIARNEPRAFGVICDPTQFTEVMEVPATILSNETYKTYISIDLIEPGVQLGVAIHGTEVLAERTFDDSIPWILVRVLGPPSYLWGILVRVFGTHSYLWAVIFTILLVAAVAIFALVLIR
jgi:hypothetical protein